VRASRPRVVSPCRRSARSFLTSTGPRTMSASNVVMGREQAACQYVSANASPTVGERPRLLRVLAPARVRSESGSAARSAAERTAHAGGGQDSRSNSAGSLPADALTPHPPRGQRCAL
jgi:hypothetical protein